ncbi:hypothetical protein SESBI_06867 [Sesbania bispinosa]|nr:hypothetical protein SESBI_06867 [Sesbania bispinosa]
MGFSVAFYHMGRFIHKPSLRYKGGEIHVFNGLDVDTWSYFEAVGLAKDLGYVDKFVQVPLIANKPADDNVQVNEVENDVNQTEVEVNKVQKNVTHTEVEVNEGQDNVTHTEVEVEVNETDVNANQTEVPVSVPNSEMGNEAMNDNEAGIHENCEIEAVVDSDSSEDSMRDVHFEDGEEERVIGADDGFTMAGMGHNEAEVDSDIRAEDNAGDASGVADRAGDNTLRTFVPPEVANMHNIDEEYESEELESDVENIDGNDETKTKYESCTHPPAQPNESQEPGTQQSQQNTKSTTNGSQQGTSTQNKPPVQQSQQRSQQDKGKSKQVPSQQSKQSQQTQQNKNNSQNSQPRVTRASKNSQKSKGTTSKAHETSSNTMNNNKRKLVNTHMKGIAESEIAGSRTTQKQSEREANSAQGASSSAAPDPQNSPFAATSLNLHPPAGQPSTSMQSGPQQDQNKEGGDATNDVGGSGSDSEPTKDKDCKAI